MPTTAISPADPASYIGLAKQAVKGTGVAPVKFPRYVGPVSMSHNPNLRNIRDAGGGDVIARTNKDFVSPDFRFAEPGRPDSFGWAFAWFLGADAVVGAGDPYQHTITKDATPLWLSGEHNVSDDIIQRMVDGQMIELTVDFRKRSSGPEILLTGVVSALDTIKQAAATSKVIETERPYIRSDCAWTLDAVAVTDAEAVESARLTLRWRVDEQMLGDKLQRVNLMKLHLEGAIEVTQLFASNNARDAYLNTHYGSPSNIAYEESTYQGSLQVVATQAEAATTRSVDINIPVVEWGDATLSDLDPDTSEATRLTRTGQLLFNSGGEPITVIVNNDVATSYTA